MQKLFYSGLVFLLAAAATALASDPPPCDGASCVPDGGSCNLCFRIEVCNIPGTGRVGATGQMWEDDSLSGNDPMGGLQAEICDDHPQAPKCVYICACGEITNRGGDLMGPNGVDQNGFPEGSDIEPFICITYQICYLSHSSRRRGISGNLGPAGGNVSGGASVTELKCHTFQECQDPVDVVPC